MNRKHAVFLWLGILSAAPSGAAVFAFNTTPAGSGLSGNVGLTAAMSGTLQGNFDAVSNATGTRTKPGLFGTFAATENLPVPVTLTPALAGPISSQPVASFQLAVDEAAGVVFLSGFSINLLPAGPLTLGTSVSLSYDSFRTRTPDSLFIGGFPLTLPLGNGELSSLLGVQDGLGATGTLTAAGSGLYDFSVGGLMLVSGTFDGALGNTALPPVPVPWVFRGRIGIAGNAAQLTMSTTFEFSQSTGPGMALPGFPLALPTLLPPGDPADVVFNLTLSNVQAELSSTLTLAAEGTAVPEPAGGMLVLAGAILGFRRRRTDEFQDHDRVEIARSLR